MAVPTPLDPAALDKLTASTFDAGVRDPLRFLLDPPAAEISLGSSMSIPNNSSTLVTYDAESADTDTMHNTVTGTSRITATTAGRYSFIFNTQFSSSGSPVLTTYSLNARKGAGGSASGGSSIRTALFGAPGGGAYQQNWRIEVVLSAGEYIELFVTQVSGAAVSLVGGFGALCTGVQVRWVSIT